MASFCSKLVLTVLRLDPLTPAPTTNPYPAPDSGDKDTVDILIVTSHQLCKNMTPIFVLFHAYHYFVTFLLG